MPFISKMIPKGSVPFGIIFGMIVLLGSCRAQYVAIPAVHQRDSLATRVNKYVDSIYIDRTHTLIQRGDTVFKTDSIYVEKFTDVEVHDTIRVTQTDSIPYPVEVPMEVPTPIPRIYKNCTTGFFLILLCIILYVFLRLYFHR